jgi:RNA-directed DNA polymerase
MKRHGHLWDGMISFENLLRAADKARRGKRFRPAAARFFFHLERELTRLHEELATRTYRPGPFRTFTVYEGKTRLISAAPFRDRASDEVDAILVNWKRAARLPCAVGSG